MNDPLPQHGLRQSPRLADIGLRLASALVMSGAALASLMLGGLVFLLFWLVIAAAVAWEWQHMVGGGRVLVRILLCVSALAIAANFASEGAADYAVEVLLAGAGAVFAVAQNGSRRWAASGVLYAGALIVSICVLRFSAVEIYQQLVIVWLFAVVWGCDIMAYFGGRLVGGPKLWARISPSKTWSGTLTGIISGAVLGLGVSLAASVPISVRAVFVLGLVLAAASQIGDLMESAMKRHFGVKDSSHLIPGHGGFMDRLDGFVFACTLAAVIGTVKINAAMSANGLFQW